MVRVKICGIKRPEDAALAVALGADAIGVLVGQQHASADFIPVEQANRIVRSLPPFVASVLVTHCQDADQVIELVRRCEVNTVQLHCPMPVERVRRIRETFGWLKIIKTTPVVEEERMLRLDLAGYAALVDAFLLDTVNPATDQVGGTGRTHDWNVSRRVCAQAERPVILAGGLTPDNVEQAIKTVCPFGVDVNSGTKAADGFKDEQKLRGFIARAKAGIRCYGGPS